MFLKLAGLMLAASIAAPVAAQDFGAPDVQNLTVWVGLGLDVTWTEQPGALTELRYRCGPAYGWGNFRWSTRLHEGSSVDGANRSDFCSLAGVALENIEFQARHIKSGQTGRWSATVFPRWVPSIELARVIPHIAQGAGWETALQVVNSCHQSHPNDLMDCREEGYAIRLTDSEGNPMQFYVRDHGMVDRLEGSINEGFDTYYFPETDSLLVGAGIFVDSIRVDEAGNIIEDAGHVVANVVYKYRDGSGVVHAASIPFMAFSEKTLRLPFQNSEGTKTGLAIVRSSPKYNATLSLGLCENFWAYDASGATISTSNQLCIPGFENNRTYKTVFMLDELEQFRNKDGVIEFRNVMSSIVVFALTFPADNSFTLQLPQIPYEFWGRCGYGCSFGPR